MITQIFKSTAHILLQVLLIGFVIGPLAGCAMFGSESEEQPETLAATQELQDTSQNQSPSLPARFANSSLPPLEGTPEGLSTGGGLALLQQAATVDAQRVRNILKQTQANSQQLANHSDRLLALESQVGSLDDSMTRVKMVEDDLETLLNELDALGAMAPPVITSKTEELATNRPSMTFPEATGRSRYEPPSREDILAEIEQRIAKTEPDSPNTETEAPSSQEAGILGLGNSHLIGLHLFSGREIETLKASWTNLAREYPELFGGMSARLVRVSFGVREGAFYRLKAGPVQNMRTAESICKTLRNRQHGCIVSEYSGVPINTL